MQITDIRVRRVEKEGKDDGDDVVIIPEEQGIINVSWFMYEFVELAIPIKHVHPFGKCNMGMASKLGEHLVSSDSFEDDDEAFSSADTINSDVENDGPIDPRWNALAALADLKKKD